MSLGDEKLNIGNDKEELIDKVIKNSPALDGKLVERKTQILTCLSDDFIDKTAELLKKDEQKSKQKNERFILEEKLYGRFFESLCYFEFAPESQTALRILFAMRHAKELGILELIGSNPDLVSVEVDENTKKVDILSVGDATTQRKLGFHKYTQLREEGFTRTVHNWVKLFRDPEKVAMYKLQSVIGDNRTLDISDRFVQRVILPSDSDITNPSELIEESEFEGMNKELNKFRDLVNDESKVRLVKSTMSRNDLRQISQFVLEKLGEKGVVENRSGRWVLKV